MQKITPCLWFDDNAEEAVNFYTTIFKDSKIGTITRYGEGGPGPKDSVMTINFELQGREFIALNGGPVYKFNEAVSFFVNCTTQEEIDYYWEKLSAGGEEIQCGWLKDKFGLTWQIVPADLLGFLQDPDPVKVSSVMKALHQMVKLDIQKLRAAYNQP